MAPPVAGQIQSGAAPDSGVQDILFGRKAQDANSPDENERVKAVKGMLAKSRQWKQNWSKNFKRWDDLWEGNFGKIRQRSTITEAGINQAWAAVETFVGHVVDALPDPIARARRSEHKKKAELITKWLKYESDSNDLEQEIQHPVRQACKRGIGWMGIGWNSEKNGKRGDVDQLPIDDDFMFPSPYARNVRELLYVIKALNVPREFVTRNWEKGEMVPPGPTDQSLMNVKTYDEQKNSIGATLVSTTTGSDSRWTGSSALSAGKKGDLVTLIEAWTREHDGTIRYTVVANDVLLQDGPSPYDDEDFPFVPFNILPTLDCIFGRSLSQFIEGLQELLNESLGLLVDQQKFASDPMLVVDSPNEEEGNLIENSPGGVLFNASPGTEGYRWLQAPGFNQAWIEIQRLISEYMDSVLGRVDVLKGERPTGVNTLGGLEIIRDEANVRVRNLIRWIKASLKRVHLLTLSRLRQYATNERTIRIVGKNGSEEFEKVNPVKGVSLDGGLEQDLTIPDDAEFDVEFEKQAPGGTQAKKEEALLLAQTPAEDGFPMVTRRHVLETFEVEDAPEIIREIEELQMMQAEAAQQEQAMASGGGAMPPGDPLDALIRQMMAGQMPGQAQPGAAPAQAPQEAPPDQGSSIASGAPTAPHPQPTGRIVKVVRGSKGEASEFHEQFTYGGAQ